MTTRQQATANRADGFEDSPTAWFVVLENARRNHDRTRATEARRQLERLGVLVRFRRRTKGGER